MKTESRAFIGLAALSLCLAVLTGFIVGRSTSSGPAPLAVVAIDRVGETQSQALAALTQEHEALQAENETLSAESEDLRGRIASLKAETMLLVTETNDQAETIAELNARLDSDTEDSGVSVVAPTSDDEAARDISPQTSDTDALDPTAAAVPDATEVEAVTTADAGIAEAPQDGDASEESRRAETETLLAGSVVALSNEDIGEALDDGLRAYKNRQFKEAFDTWKPLAELGVARAQFYLGGLYRDGAGVKRDMVQAYVWLKRSQQAGYRFAGDLAASVESDMTAEQIASAQGLLAEGEQ